MRRRKKTASTKIVRRRLPSDAVIKPAVAVTPSHEIGGICKIVSVSLSILNPVTNSPFKKLVGASSTTLSPLVNSLKEKNPRLASLTSQRTREERYLLKGMIQDSG